MKSTVRFTDVSDGSFAITESDEALRQRRLGVVDAPCTWLRQTHSSTCVTVTEPGFGAGAAADAAVTAIPGVALSVITADCAPVLLRSDTVVGAVHAGWRGLVAGVLPTAIAAMRTLGATEITAVLGPCIRTRCYEFGEAEMALATSTLGSAVRGTTAWGSVGFDVAAGVRESLRSVGVTEVADAGVCTACSPSHWSHRARADTGRQAAVIWLEP